MMGALNHFPFTALQKWMMKRKVTVPEEIEAGTLMGFSCVIDHQMGLLSVEHDGTITWDQLQELKNAAFGEEARAIEVYPAQSQMVNSRHMRHLWRLGESDFCPDLLGDDNGHDSLIARHAQAWSEARR